MDYRRLLAGRTRLMQANAIREILKVVSDPGIISLAGGIPSPDSFPMEIFEELTARVISTTDPRPFNTISQRGSCP